MKDIIKYKGFIGSVHYSGEDRLFYGKVEGVSDLITFEGKTVDELESGFRYMIEEHIKDCKREHRPLEKSYKGSLNVRLSPELHKKAAYNAAIRGISLNQYINEAVRKEVRTSEPETDYGAGSDTEADA